MILAMTMRSEGAKSFKFCGALLMMVGFIMATGLSGAAGRKREAAHVSDDNHEERVRGNGGSVSSSEEAMADRVYELPGQPHETLPLLQYAGYVTVNRSAGRALFYWLVEATSSFQNRHNLQQNTSPLVLWLNGGPGCSSMGYGGMEELGPFKIHPNGTALYSNPYAWTQVANVLFLESPAGVGYSYSNTSIDYKTSSDARTAEDSLAFLMAWLERFPQYRGRDLYITGESYAGHYVPQLAHMIHKHNARLSKATSTTPLINLKGFMVGNAVTDSGSDKEGIINFYWSHALISDETYEGLLRSCRGGHEAPASEACQKWFDKAYREVGNIDLHTIYTPICLTPDPYQSSRTTTAPKHWSPLTSGWTGYDPCTPNYADTYFNRIDVQKAFHANTSGIVKGPWMICNYEILDNWHDRVDSVLPIYRELIAAGLRIWVYSGDEDAMVPVSGTRLWLKKLGLKIRKPWYSWVNEGQVAGWTQVYRGLTFATVRGAGHEVPVLQPKRALALFSSFLQGKPLPSSRN